VHCWSLVQVQIDVRKRQQRVNVQRGRLNTQYSKQYYLHHHTVKRRGAPSARRARGGGDPHHRGKLEHQHRRESPSCTNCSYSCTIFGGAESALCSTKGLVEHTALLSRQPLRTVLARTALCSHKGLLQLVIWRGKVLPRHRG
jgi:hypothetical protein